MRKTILPLIILFGIQFSAGQTNSATGPDKPLIPKINTVYFKLGERVIQIKTYQYGAVKDIVYINLHDNEITAINGAQKVLEKRGGLLIKIENYRTRNIKFKLEGKQYTIDPNRMFSRPGIARSLLIFGNTSPKAIDEVEKFANRILQLIPPHPTWIIALHNNTNGKYSVNSYRRGGDKEEDARNIHVNDDHDADDFFLTTDSVLFNRLSGDRYNAILQDNINAKRDGSLSIYCGERNIQYINCETEHGRQPEYDQMIAMAVNKLAPGSSGTITAISKPETKTPEAVITETKTDTKNTRPITPASKPDSKKQTAVIPGKKTENKRSGSSSKSPIETAANKPITNVIGYSYRIAPAMYPFSLQANTEVHFGERKVGWIRSVVIDSSKATVGRFEMDKSFALYSNMDFFLFISFSAVPRLELRIDPTRKGELVNPQSGLVHITTKLVN
jgi:hypothetical protein